jgi:hypothetical protein
MTSRPDPDDRFVVHSPSGDGKSWNICDRWHRELPFPRGYTDSVFCEEGSQDYVALVQRCQELNADHRERLQTQVRMLENGEVPIGLVQSLHPEQF